MKAALRVQESGSESDSQHGDMWGGLNESVETWAITGMEEVCGSQIEDTVGLQAALGSVISRLEKEFDFYIARPPSSLIMPNFI